MTGETRAALAEARELLAACRGRLGGDEETALALLAQAVGRLADAVEAEAAGDSPPNVRVVDDGSPPGGRPFDRSRPHRGYNRDA